MYFGRWEFPPKNGGGSKAPSGRTGLDPRVQSVLVPLVQTVQAYWSIQKLAYFGRKFLIGYSIFRREKPFADEEQSG